MVKKRKPNLTEKGIVCKYCGKAYNEHQDKMKKISGYYYCEICSEKFVYTPTGEIDKHGNMVYEIGLKNIK